MRAPAKANEILDALVAALDGISASTGGPEWATDPADVRRRLLIGDVTQSPKPAIYVALDAISDRWLMKPVSHESVIECNIHCVSASWGESEPELVELVADVFNALASDESLGGLILLMEHDPARFDAEAMTATGLGIATIPLRLTYRWEHGEP